MPGTEFAHRNRANGSPLRAALFVNCSIGSGEASFLAMIRSAAQLLSGAATILPNRPFKVPQAA
jgi:hypothetical protein